ncbi:unnamed protein product [Symbiodinium sp. KB8]|nr:unnamed protein product [Symbiodinium sp. KB8]
MYHTKGLLCDAVTCNLITGGGVSAGLWFSRRQLETLPAGLTRSWPFRGLARVTELYGYEDPSKSPIEARNQSRERLSDNSRMLQMFQAPGAVVLDCKKSLTITATANSKFIEITASTAAMASQEAAKGVGSGRSAGFLSQCMTVPWTRLKVWGPALVLFAVTAAAAVTPSWPVWFWYHPAAMLVGYVALMGNAVLVKKIGGKAGKPDAGSPPVCQEDSMADVMANILDEEPECGWMEEFWFPVLEASPPEICLSTSGRSISHWIELFNRWQAAGGWNPGSAPKFMDAYAFRDFIATPMTKALKWVKVFDPPAFCQLEATKSKMAYQNVKISPAAVLTSSILIATKIAKKQKIRFILGVFDEDDSETFDRNEFVEMISSFLMGLGILFGSSVPKPSRRQWIGKLLFDRIQMMACCKLPALEAKMIKSSDSMPFSLLEEWFLGESGDPFAVPFALLLERYSLGGFNEDPEKFEVEDKKFKITHKRRVAPPVETESSLDMSFIKRHRIEPLRRIFDLCQKDSYFAISHGEAERALETSIHPDLWCNFAARGLEQLESMPQSRKGVTFLAFLKMAMPHAQPRHHRMFSSWLQELDEIEQLKKQVATSRSEQNRFQNYISRLPLRAGQRQKLEEQFEVLGKKARASGDVEDEEVAHDPILEGLQGRDKMTKEDYIAAKCGIEARPNESKPELDEVVGDFLRLQLRQLEETLAQMESLFASGNGVTRRPSFIKPAVTQRQWSLWNHAFDMMTPTAASSGRVTLKEFAFQHDLCPATCLYLCQSIGHSTEVHELGFTKEEFLQKMLDTFRYRVRKEFLIHGRLCET